MSRYIGWALVALALLTAVPVASTQPPASKPSQDSKDAKGTPGHGPTAWWKDDKARAEIGFNAEQAAEIERIFKAYIDKARPLRDEVNGLEKALSETMKANTADVSVVAQQVEKVENKRAELNKLRVITLYRMSRVLTAEQNVRLQAYRDRREAARKKQDR